MKKSKKKEPPKKTFFFSFVSFGFYDVKHTSAARFLLDLCGYKNNASPKNNHTKHTRFTTTLYTKNGSHYHGISG